MTIKDDLSIVIAGQAGQGVQSVELIVAHTLKADGYNIFATTEYMSRVRGGTNSTQVRVSSEGRRSYLDRIDIFVPLDPSAIPHCEDRLSKDTIIIGEKAKLPTDRDVFDVPLLEMANTIGNRVFANTIAAGVVLGMMQVDIEGGIQYVRSLFARKGEDIAHKNIQALRDGYKLGEHIAFTNDLSVVIKKNPAVKDDVLFVGIDAVGFGALAGGVNFCTSYPMSPSTGLLTFLAQYGKEYSVLVEQATDEIGAINMSLGASYAGARAIVTTSGGGFALMTEGISLAAITETPIVIHLAQRPGPATGLPTRTAQEDLNLALYAGHGEFPRVIYAPGTLKQAYELTARAINTADAYQLPVMILTDQHFVDTLSTLDPKEFAQPENIKHIVKTEKGYKRYALTQDGISPRGIPGNGQGYVCVDSDEHDESGHITESAQVRDAMTEKRMHKKMKLLLKDAIAPEIFGDKEYTTLVVCWGSNYHVTQEALTESKKKKASVVHFSQLYPLHKSTKKILAQAKKIICVENNETGQFADLLTRETGVHVTQRITKSNGNPFSVEELTVALKKV